MGAVLGLVGLLFGALNFFGGIIAVVWLAYLGEWRVLGLGLLALMLAPMALGLLVLLGMVFGAPAVALLERGRSIVAFPLVLLSHAYTHVLVAAWGLLVFFEATNRLTEQNFWPLLLWSYSVAVGPWSYMAAKESQSGGGEGAVITTFFAQLAYVVMVGTAVIYRCPIVDLVIMYGTILLVSVILQTLIAYAATSEWQSGTPAP